MIHPIRLALILIGVLAVQSLRGVDDQSATRATIVQALTAEDGAQSQIIRSLIANGGPFAAKLLTQWREGGIYFIEGPDGKKVPVILGDKKDAQGNQPVFALSDEKPFIGGDGKPMMAKASSLEVAETDSSVRKAIREVTEMAGLSDPIAKQRIKAIQNLGVLQDYNKLPALEARLAIEPDSSVVRVLQEAVALTKLKSTDIKERIASCSKLGAMGSIPSQDALKTLAAQAAKDGQPEVADAANSALKRIASHVTVVNTVGTMFRGLSTGSILLVVAIGLAITFGLMGVINMAHGELLVVGAYTTYVVQCVFGPGLALSPFGFSITIPGFHTVGPTYNSYFLVALPCSFLMAALVGIGLERCVIRFLYSRPLESLLATWGVSLVMQQLFRLTFGSNNVQVDSPSWLSGNWTVNDILFGWNRVFVICFAVLIIVMTWLVLNKTPLGLLIRAVMQNRNMAACMGVRTERVNMLTFGFGSGLAGLAGAFLSQVGNVGPSLGQSYIVDAFMTVVVGGVGSLVGTVVSALGIGVTDNVLQQVLGNPVLGKILVLGAIILFLQWKPQGLFVTKSRSLES
jgi:urea transport system permease protein